MAASTHPAVVDDDYLLATDPDTRLRELVAQLAAPASTERVNAPQLRLPQRPHEALHRLLAAAVLPAPQLLEQPRLE